jgi:para-nitrobenzyl esterase
VTLPAGDVARPVLFFIHGGGNGVGSASERTLGTDIYDSAALAEGADAVVVTAEYRLGTLGWIVDPVAVAS